MGVRMESQQQIKAGNGDEQVPLIQAPAPISIELVHLFDKMQAVKAFVFDVDGVFTNNDLLVTEAGELLRTMSVRDGQAVMRLPGRRWLRDDFAETDI